ncbi:armadillo repeat-containing protein 8-like [Dendronephthya gigantea]|uniref:armadillo repeat-containing protein 8-like n=1 Tax=Dendronephthya gigantea TaxID=151771 RepID=UPI001069083D|nr:armadillo repeat-containing protein 8-like [Dendronephthya gigantea]
MKRDTENVFMDPGDGIGLVDQLLSSDAEISLQAARNIKNVVIGSKANKKAFIQLDIASNLVHLLQREQTNIELAIEAVVILGSLARADDETVTILLAHSIIPLFLQGLKNSNRKLAEASIRSLRTFYISPQTPVDPIYEDTSNINCLIQLLCGTHIESECAAHILARCCQNSVHQKLLARSGLIEALVPLVGSSNPKLQLPALQCYAALSLENEVIADMMKTATFKNESLIEVLKRLLPGDKPDAIRLSAAKCLTNLSRAGAFPTTDPLVRLKVLPCLVKLCKKEKEITIRAESAEVLGYLIEEDAGLQQTAAIADHLIPTLANYLRKNDLNEDDYARMRETALKAFASLGASDEDIRKRIIETESTMDHVVMGIEDSRITVQLAAVKCLHSLSRSVHQLRTTFQDNAVWKPLMKLLQGASEEVLKVASSAVCNLLLEFSPSKESILEAGAVKLLVELTKHENNALRLNGVWGLMNMAYQSDENTKNRILERLGTGQIFHLLEDNDTQVVMKTLGLMRNLLSGRDNIDHIMALHGSDVMRSLQPIIDDNSSQICEVKEQALCILGNIANGRTAKDYLMSDDGLLKRLKHYITQDNVKLKMAAIYCISNLAWSTDEGASERQTVFRDLGILKLLQDLSTTADPLLFDRVKTALQQFS